MHLFVLTPFNPKWPTAYFKKIDYIIVRAESETKARQLVKSVTFNTQKSKIGTGQIHILGKILLFLSARYIRVLNFQKKGKRKYYHLLH